MKVTVDGYALRQVGRFAGGDHRDDVVWFDGVNVTGTQVWRGNANRTFTIQ